MRQFVDIEARRERARELGHRNRTHGHSLRPNGVRKTSREYTSYQAMRKRCLNPNHEAYERYAVRGITICQRWLDSFENFIADMGLRPKGKTLERIDNEKGYEPGNCEWATPKKQMSNTRANIMLTVDGITKSLPVWAEEAGQKQGLIKCRVYAGWSHKAAIFTPIRGKVPERTEERRKNIIALREKLSEQGNWKFGPRTGKQAYNQDGVCFPH